jgi:hypothetical protein
MLSIEPAATSDAAGLTLETFKSGFFAAAAGIAKPGRIATEQRMDAAIGPARR